MKGRNQRLPHLIAVLGVALAVPLGSPQGLRGIPRAPECAAEALAIERGCGPNGVAQGLTVLLPALKNPCVKFFSIFVPRIKTPRSPASTRNASLEALDVPQTLNAVDENAAQ